MFYDIETSPSLGYYFDPWKENNIVSTVRPWFMLSFAYKVQGEKKIHFHCLADYPNYSKNKTCDRALVTDLYQKVFCSADILVGQNIDRFDGRKSRARFLAHGLPPPPPVKTRDTLKIAKRIFKLDFNNLAALGEYLGLGGKAVTTGWKLWEACIEGDLRAWRQMGVYNKRDVDLNERVFDRLAPWDANAPYVGQAGCPSCFSEHITHRGFLVNRTGRRQRWQCQACGHWFAGAQNAKTKAFSAEGSPRQKESPAPRRGGRRTRRVRRRG